jgi:fructose-specific phosphotransferase system IIC component
MGEPGFALFSVLFLFLVGLLITAALMRWLFRINDIVKRLDDIVTFLGETVRLLGVKNP